MLSCTAKPQRPWADKATSAETRIITNTNGFPGYLTTWIRLYRLHSTNRGGNVIRYKDVKEDSRRNVRYTVVDINANCSDLLLCLSSAMHNAINAQPNPAGGLDICFFWVLCNVRPWSH